MQGMALECLLYLSLHKERDFFDSLSFYKRRPSKNNRSKEEDNSEARAEAEALSGDKVLEYEVPEHDGQRSVGSSFVRAVKGSFCRLCKKYLGEGGGGEDGGAHLKSEAHHRRFAEAVAARKEERQRAAEERKRKVRTS